MAKENQDDRVKQNHRKSKGLKFGDGEERLKRILDNAGSGIYIVQGGKIVFHNHHFSKLTGYSSRALMEMDFIDLVHPKDKKLIRLIFSNDFREINLKQSRSYTFRISHRNGELRWFKSNVSIIDWNGLPALLDSCFDITHQRDIEQKLMEEEQNFRLLVNAFEDMVFIISKRSAIIQANKSVFNYLKLEEHQLLLKNFSTLFPISEREEVRKAVVQAFSGSRILISGNLETEGGKFIPVETRLFNGNWSQKEVVFAICQDISVRLEAERIVKLSEEKFSKAFDNNAVMMTITTLDEGVYLDVNETFLNTVGLGRHDVIGKQSSELNIFPDIDRREELKQLIVKDGKAQNIETTILNKNGETLICLFSAEMIDIQDTQCILMVMSDITQRKLAQEKIQQSELRFRQLGELLPEMVFEVDAKGYITFANNYLLSFFGLTPDSINRRIEISTFFEKKSQKIINSYIKQSHLEPHLPSVELVAIKNKKQQVPVLTHITAIVEKGKVNRFMGIMVDITNQKHQEQELIKAKELAEEASKAKEQFLSIMSHEIRTPMNAVIGMANILLQEDPMDYQLENLKTLRYSAENLMSLLNDILDFNKIEAGKLKFFRSSFSLQSLLKGLHSSFKHVAIKKGIELKLEFDYNIPENLIGDSVRINQILTNLVSNAIKFTEKGEVVVKVQLIKETKRSVSVFFSVSDSGIGIPPEKQQIIFQEFTQANLETTRKYGGSGLGLAISKQLVMLLKGKIEVKSQYGKGSEFFFTLCFNKSKASVKDKQLDKEVVTFPEREGKPFKILVVEDNEINSMIALKFLKNWGFLAELAEDGMEAIEKVKKEDFDLILMDLEMPVMSGYEAAVQIRKLTDPRKNRIPIIALTASAMLDIQTRIFNIGMNGFILKPFNPQELKKKIALLLEAQ
jgi:PAS domain S-box-containing protein